MLIQPNTFLAFLSGILVLRLVIWQFFLNMKYTFREEFSDVAVATFILSLVLPWLIGKVVNRQTLKRSGLELPLLLLFAAAASSLFYTVDFPSSLRSVLVLGAGIAFFYILLDLLDTPARLRFILIFLLGITFVAAVYGIKTYFDLLMRPDLQKNAYIQLTNNNLSYLLVHPRAISFFGWPNTLAGFLLLFLPLALILPIYLQKVWQKGIAAVILLVLVACFLCTFSFLGWMSFMLSTIVLLPFFRQKLKIKIWPVILVFFTLFLLVILHKNFWESLSPRLFYYKAAFTLLLKNPLWGWGWNSFGIMSSSMTSKSYILSAYVHNSYLQAWVEAGIIGFAGIVSLAVFIFRKAQAAIYKNDQQREHLILVALAWGMIAFLIDNLFSFTILQFNVSLFWWAMLAVFCAMARMGTGESTGEKGKPLAGIFFFILVVFMFAVLVRIFGGYAFYYQSQKAINNDNPIRLLGSNSKAIEILKRAKTLDPWSSYLPAAIGESYMNLFQFTRLKGMLVLAKTDYLEAVRRSPKYYYNYFVLGKIYGALGDKTNEATYTQKAKELSPGEFALDDEMFNRSANPPPK